MPEQSFDTYSDNLPLPTEESQARDNPPTVHDAGGQIARSRRKPPARKRQKRADTASASKATKARRERDELHVLEAQGFTREEAVRLLRVEDPNEAVMRRLRFQRWLIEHGRLDEFSA